MRYEIGMIETYKACPDARIYTNYTTSVTVDSIQEALIFLKETSREIRKCNQVLKEWNETANGSVVHKILFKRHGQAARLLRTLTVHKSRKAVYDDSLI